MDKQQRERQNAHPPAPILISTLMEELRLKTMEVAMLKAQIQYLTSKIEQQEGEDKAVSE